MPAPSPVAAPAAGPGVASALPAAESCSDRLRRLAEPVREERKAKYS